MVDYILTRARNLEDGMPHVLPPMLCSLRITKNQHILAMSEVGGSPIALGVHAAAYDVDH